MLLEHVSARNPIGGHIARVSCRSAVTLSPPGAGRRVAVEELSTCQDPHQTGKPGAG